MSKQLNTNTKAKVLEHFAEQAEDVWKAFAKMLDEGYFNSDTVRRMLGEDATDILFQGKVRATVRMTWNARDSRMEPEDFTAEYMQERMSRADSTHVCQTSGKGTYYGDWATIESIETEMQSPTPEEVFGEGNEKAMMFAIAEETIGREALFEKVPHWREHFQDKPISTIVVTIERPNTTSKNDVASYLRSFVRDYIADLRPANTVCTELEVLLPEELQHLLEDEESEDAPELQAV